LSWDTKDNQPVRIVYNLHYNFACNINRVDSKATWRLVTYIAVSTG